MDAKFIPIIAAIIIAGTTLSIYVFNKLMENHRLSKSEIVALYKDIIIHSKELSPKELIHETSLVKLGFQNGEWKKGFILKKRIKYQFLKDKRLKKMLEVYDTMLNDLDSSSGFGKDLQTKLDDETRKRNKANEQWQRIVRYCEEKTKENIRTIDQ
jgi:hypothetical protein